MSFNYIRKIPTTEEVLEKMPLPDYLVEKKKIRDEEIRKVFTGESDKFLMIIGPCSADNSDAVCDYVSRLAAIQEKVKDKIIIIPRIYTNKPRTTGEGYKGMLHQPDPLSSPNISEGIYSIRELHIRALKESGLFAADEMLYPSNEPYLNDILSYIAVGARSVENQQHRLTVSGLDIPCGMKNPTSGDIGVMFNSIHAGQASHIFIYNGFEVETEGNDLTHAILRGAVNHHGTNIPNYHYEDLLSTTELYKMKNLNNPAIIVDTNHANSTKKYKEQARIAHEILYCKKINPEINKVVKGLMVESYIVEGNQSVDGTTYGQSITDPCLGWADSEKMIYRVADEL